MSNADGFNGYNEGLNRGKRSIELDLKHPKSRPVMEKLIKWCDVVVENYKVGVMDRLGYGYDYMKNLNRRVIFCCNSGFGPEGSWSKRGSFDLICQAFSGAMVVQGGGPDHRPGVTEWGLADQVGALNFAFHIAAALVARGGNGDGQKLECSQLGAMVQFQSIRNVGSWYNKEQRNDGRAPFWDSIELSQYQCGDGKWLTCAPSMEERHYESFCKVTQLTSPKLDVRLVFGLFSFPLVPLPIPSVT